MLKIVILQFLVLLIASNTVHAEPLQLRISLQLPITTHIGANLIAFKTSIEAKSKQALQIEIIDNSRAFNDETVTAAVGSGAIEMGVVNLTRLGNQVPAVDLFRQPFLFNSDAIVRAATDPNRELRVLIDNAIREVTGLRVLWWQPFGSSIILSKGRDAVTPEKVKDRNVRAAGGADASLMQNCGAKPKVLGGTKLYDAVKSGEVDYVMSGITNVEGRRLWEVTDTVTRTEHGAVEFVVVINERLWLSLDPRLQTAITESAREVEQQLRESYAKIEDAAYSFARSKGMQIKELTSDQLAQWLACSAPVTDAFMNDAGVLGQQLLALYGQLRTEPCCVGRSDPTFPH
jgi:C4-dicarboxylate-binding protein DctP